MSEFREKQIAKAKEGEPYATVDLYFLGPEESYHEIAMDETIPEHFLAGKLRQLADELDAAGDDSV